MLAAQAPDLHEALERARAESLSHLILDGKVIGTDRVTEPKLSRKGERIDAWYAGKTHDFGGLIQALMNPRGILLWVFEVMPGSIHDLTAARELVLAILAPYVDDLPVLPTAATKAQATVFSSRSRRARAVASSTRTPAHTTSCCERYGAWASTASPYWSPAGRRSST